MTTLDQVIKRHLENGRTEEEARRFFNQVNLMVSKGLITREEANRLLETATIDCIG